MDTDLILKIVCGAAMVGVISWSIFFRERLRTKKLKALAPTLGLRMVNGNGRFSSQEFHCESPLFHRGKSGTNRLWNAMESTTAGQRSIVFDLRFEVEVGGGPDSTTSTSRQTVVAYQAQRDLPSFSIQKIGFLSRNTENKIQIEGNMEFSNRFLVVGADHAAIQKLLNPALMQFLTAAQLPEKIVIEGAGPWLIFYRSNKRFHPRLWKGFIEETSVLAGDFLRHCSALQTTNADSEILAN